MTFANLIPMVYSFSKETAYVNPNAEKLEDDPFDKE